MDLRRSAFLLHSHSPFFGNAAGLSDRAGQLTRTPRGSGHGPPRPCKPLFVRNFLNRATGKEKPPHRCSPSQSRACTIPALSVQGGPIGSQLTGRLTVNPRSRSGMLIAHLIKTLAEARPVAECYSAHQGPSLI